MAKKIATIEDIIQNIFTYPGYTFENPDLDYCPTKAEIEAAMDPEDWIEYAKEYDDNELVALEDMTFHKYEEPKPQIHYYLVCYLKQESGYHPYTLLYNPIIPSWFPKRLGNKSYTLFKGDTAGYLVSSMPKNDTELNKEIMLNTINWDNKNGYIITELTESEYNNLNIGFDTFSLDGYMTFTSPSSVTNSFVIFEKIQVTYDLPLI